MSGLWTTMAAVGGPMAAVLGGWFAARATRGAAAVTAEAHLRAAKATSAPEDRLADLAVFKASVERVDEENARLRQRLSALETLVRAFTRYVLELTAQLRAHGVEPPAPPERITDYDRTGV